MTRKNEQRVENYELPALCYTLFFEFLSITYFLPTITVPFLNFFFFSHALFFA